MAGGGATSDTVVTTNASGVAATNWYVGPTAGQQNRLRVSHGNLALEFTATSAAGVVGAQYFGEFQYMEYIPGNLPIVISAPHGGTLTPVSIPDRTAGTSARDTNTEELARQMGDAFQARLGRRPHIVICRLRRTKLDANREIVEAAQGNREAQRAWYEWHAFIDAARARVAADYPRGLYMDLHGHGHTIQRLELGYLLSSTELQLPELTLNGVAIVNTTSIRALVQSSGATLTTLLRGPFSLGTLYEAVGFPSVPSASQPHPGANDYFSGGYNTDRHGSRVGGVISGFQLEANFTGVRDTQQTRAAMADATVDVFVEYMSRHFGMDIETAQKRDQ
jgi:N-formylglutamate amidohydrolase